MTSADVYHLSRVRWAIWATLTFCLDGRTRRQMRRSFHHWRSDVARELGVNELYLPWALRRETGETFGRLHMHALIAGVPVSRITPGLCYTFNFLWTGYVRVTDDGRKYPTRFGWAQVYAYKPDLPLVDYVSKCLTGTDDGSGQRWESARFDENRCDLTLSKSATAIIASEARRDGLALRAQLSGAV